MPEWDYILVGEIYTLAKHILSRIQPYYIKYQQNHTDNQFISVLDQVLLNLAKKLSRRRFIFGSHA